MGLPVKRSIISLLSRATAWRQGIVARPGRHWLIVLGLLATFNLKPSTVLAQGTAFLYQGRLNDGGNPANGNYDLRFTIYDSTNNPGVVIAGPLTNSATVVSNGLFTANLDYGPGVFTGPARWLDLGVRTNGSTNGFVVLSPRQMLTPTPYAIFANTASNLSGTLSATQLTGTLPASAFAGGYTNAVALTNNGNIFGGTFTGIFSGNFGGTFTGGFSGNGGGLTNVNVMNLTGVLADGQLPSNTAFVNSNQTFIGSNVFTGTNLFGGFNVFSGPTNSFNGAFSGNGINLTNLNGSQINSGTVADARLSANVPLLNTNQIFTGSNIFRGANTFAGTNTFTGVNTFTNSANSFIGSFFGNGLVGWIVVSGTSTQAISDAGYLLVSTQLTTVTLPPSPNVDDVVRVSGGGAGGWKVAQNAGQAILGNFSGFSGSSWTASGASTLSWYDIAASADGTKMVAVIGVSGGIYTSTDSGRTWGSTSANPGAWRAVTSSADGSKLAAALNGSVIYTSTNSGSTWVQRTTGLPGSSAWSSIASSADGTKLVAVVNGGGVYTSANSGSSWTQQTSGLPNSGVAAWTSVASSSDGTKLAAAGGSGIYISSNSGGSWSSSSSGSTWSSIASSADGTKLVAAQNTGGIYTSANGGAWTQQTTGVPASAAWTSVTSSSDGGKLAATVGGGGIYTSLNWGATWTQPSGAPNASWSAITSSADGSKLAAVVNSTSSGGIYYLQASPQTLTTVGIAGGITGGQGTALELQYIGNGQFMPVSTAGIIWGY
jgi:photosystem II stability/assembly factor-like uncharacterized protein